MEDNNDEQIERARPEEVVLHSDYPDLHIDICKHIIAHIPANELRSVHRPENMAPRTFFLEQPFELLPAPLNEPCVEEPAQYVPPKIRAQLIDNNQQTMEQFLKGRQFKLVYNKLDSYRPDSKYFTGKLKGLDSMADYNWKSFKQLQVSKPRSQQTDSIDSNFEGGNTCRAYLSTATLQPQQYFLLIENDLNTYGYNIWFFFRFRNRLEGPRRFHIINIIKDTAFYNQGMMISIFSVSQHQRTGRRWFKGGQNISFQKTNFPRNNHLSQYYYSLSFDYTFEDPSDEVYFALSQPYTYSRLVNFIERSAQQISEVKMEVKTACYSISNNILPLLRFWKAHSPQKQEAVIIMARQHPCETVGSFIVEAMITQLLSSTGICNHLLQQFEVYVIPMVNPDGVIHGMSRTNMAGLDLNRQWSQLILKEMTPETSKLQQLITHISRKKGIKYVLDLHGHGKKLNSFFFSCKTNELRDSYRLFSYVMKKLETRFNLSSCTYGIAKDKETTLRSKMNSLGIRHSYTVETSQFGWKNDKGEILHFNEADYKSIAKNILNSIFVMECDPKLTEEYLGLSKSTILSELESVEELLEREEKNNEAKDNLSDSDPEGDRLDVKDLISRCDNRLIKKKIQESFRNQPLKFTSKKRPNLPGSQLQKNPRKRWHNREDLIRTPSGQSNSKFSLLRGNSINEEDPKESLEKPEKDLRYMIKKSTMKMGQRKKKVMIPIRINTPIQTCHLEQTHIRETQKRRRISTEPVDRDRAHLSSSMGGASEYSQGKLPCSHAPKTEKHEVWDKDNEIYQNVQLKLSELKKESLNHILTETISIMKVGLQAYTRKTRQNQSSLRSSCHEEEENIKRRCRTISQKQASQEPQEKPSRMEKYKNFKQFMVKHGNNFPNRTTKPTNSVYYHFPIL